MPAWKIDEGSPLRAAYFGGNARVAIRANGDIPSHASGWAENAPGNDGLGREFYSHNWVIIKDDLCEVIDQCSGQSTYRSNIKRSVIVCLPKAQGIQTPEDYRPITLLNSDY